MSEKLIVVSTYLFFKLQVSVTLRFPNTVDYDPNCLDITTLELNNLYFNTLEK